MQLARDLLTDFREVEQNFRILDRRSAGTHRPVGRLEGRAARRHHERAGHHLGFRPGTELSCVLGFPDVARSAGGADGPAGAGSRPAGGHGAQPRRPNPAHTLRLAGGRRAHAAHRGPALAAVAPVPRRQGVAREPPHHGHPARHRIEGACAAGVAAAGRRDAPRGHRGRHHAADGAPAAQAAGAADHRGRGAGSGGRRRGRVRALFARGGRQGSSRAARPAYPARTDRRSRCTSSANPSPCSRVSRS